jgi:hypothetical protein
MVNIFAKLVDTSNFLKVIDKVHDEIHEGNFYTISRSTTLIAASTFFISVVTPNSTVAPHFTFNVTAAAPATVGLYGTATVASTWAATTLNNNNQRSTKTATSVIRLAVPSSDVTSTGTLLESFEISSFTPSYIGGAFGIRSEWVLGQNLNYLIKVNSVSTNSITYNLQVYED